MRAAPGTAEGVQDNGPHFDYRTQSPASRAHQTSLYQTWNQLGGSTEQPSSSMNDRVDGNSISPRGHQIYTATNPMQASLAGNSQLQFLNESTAPGFQEVGANQIGESQTRDGRAFSPIPMRNQAPGAGQGDTGAQRVAMSPQSRQLSANFLGGA